MAAVGGIDIDAEHVVVLMSDARLDILFEACPCVTAERLYGSWTPQFAVCAISATDGVECIVGEAHETEVVVFRTIRTDALNRDGFRTATLGVCHQRAVAVGSPPALVLLVIHRPLVETLRHIVTAATPVLLV